MLRTPTFIEQLYLAFSFAKVFRRSSQGEKEEQSESMSAYVGGMDRASLFHLSIVYAVAFLADGESLYCVRTRVLVSVDKL